MAKHAGMRKGIPSHEVPMEVWRMLLNPTDVQKQLKLGLGACSPLSTPKTFQRCFLQLLQVIRATGHAPRQFHYSQGILVHKKAMPHCKEDTDELCSDARVVHCFGALPKLYIRHAWNQLPSAGHPDNLFGAIRNRSREEAIIIQEQMCWSLSQNGLSSATRFYDVRNAFPSVDLRKLTSQIEHHQHPFGPLILQHLTQHVCKLAAPDGSLLLSPGCGVPQGSSVATDLFNAVCADVVTALDEQVSITSPALVGVSPLTGRKKVVANTVFVDDVASKNASFDCRDVLPASEVLSDALSKELAEKGMTQNESKAEILLHLLGPGSKQCTRKAFTSAHSKCRAHARYLDRSYTGMGPSRKRYPTAFLLVRKLSNAMLASGINPP
eukprot:6466688-Amphidinium_carterae.1